MSNQYYKEMVEYIKWYCENVGKRGPTSEELFDKFAPGADARSEFWLINLALIVESLEKEGVIMGYRLIGVSEDWRWVCV